MIHRVVSAPGKVLMTGGYLILERPNAGIVLSTNARFYAIVKPLCEEIKPESWSAVCAIMWNSLLKDECLHFVSSLLFDSLAS